MSTTSTVKHVVAIAFRHDEPETFEVVSHEEAEKLAAFLAMEFGHPEHHIVARTERTFVVEKAQTERFEHKPKVRS